jgi:hypothetical protein
MHQRLNTRRNQKTLQDRIAGAPVYHRSRGSHNEETRAIDLTQPNQTRFSQGFTVAIQNLFAKPEQETQPRITGEHILALLLLGLTFFVRITNLSFNTLHLDEAIYTTVGEDVLAGVFKQGAIQWIFGSYWYPIMASLADTVAGTAGLRILSAVLMTVAAFFVYLIGLRLFSGQAGLWALFLFGLSGISLNLGQHAVYDALGVPLLAVTLYLLIRAVQQPDRQQIYLQWAGVIFSLCVLAKYIALLLLPALLMAVFMLHIYYGRGIWAFFRNLSWQSFIVPMLLILGIYAAIYRTELQIVLTGQFASQNEDRLVIFRDTIEQIGIPVLATGLGVIAVIQKAVKRLSVKRPGLFLLFILTFPLLLLFTLAMPTYHLVTANVRALWKHNVYTLVFLAPLAGYGVSQLISGLRTMTGGRLMLLRTVGALATAIGLFWFMMNAVRQNVAFHHSWPNNEGVIEHLRALNVTPETKVLSSSYAIYEYYFDFGVNDRQTWSNVWYTEYGDLRGTEAVQQAIQDCAFDLAILDNFYAPEWSGTLAAQLQQVGYVISYSTTEMLAEGTPIVTNVYVSPGDGCLGQASQDQTLLNTSVDSAVLGQDSFVLSDIPTF